MNLTKRLCSLLLALLLVASLTVPALAADGNVTYSGDAGEFIFVPGTDYSPTDLFPNFKDVMPGDTITQRILIKNDASKRVNVTIYMRSLGSHLDQESIDFLSQMELKVVQVGESDLFEAPANETAQLTEWTSLGTVKSGGTVELEVTLTVPVTMDNEFKQMVGYLDWQFRVEEVPNSDMPPTGDQMNLTLYIVLLALSGLVIVIVVILLLRKKKEEPESKPAEPQKEDRAE